MRAAFVLLFCCAVMLFGLQACKPGCRDVECRNGGTCRNGQCQCEGRWTGAYCDTLCPIGWEGRYCATPSCIKFIRTWQATTTSNGSSVQHSLTITQGDIVQHIVISNFNNEGYSVVGSILDYNSFEILPQNATGSYTGPVQGSGYLNGNNLAINLTKEGVDYFANCNK